MMLDRHPDTGQWVVHRAVPRRTVATAFTCLAFMLRSGLNLVRGLEILGGQEEHVGFRRQLHSIRDELLRGMPLSFALRSHPRTFSPVQVALVEAGEASGTLPEVLDRLARTEEKECRLRDRVRSASVYPACALAVSSGVLVVLSRTLVQSTAPLFAATGQTLPPVTRLLLAATSPGGLLLGLLAIALAAGLCATWMASETGYREACRAVLRVPWLGTLLVRLELSRILRSLSALYISGMPLLAALQVARGMTRYPDVQGWLLRVGSRVEGGTSLGDALAEVPAMPKVVGYFASVGERTGALGDMLGRVADWYDGDIDHAIDTFMAALEPALICGMGAVVGAIVLLAFAPVYQLMGRVAL